MMFIIAHWYASTDRVFLAFVAATLDLSQVLVRKQQNTTVTHATIAGFIQAREVFLSLFGIFP